MLKDTKTSIPTALANCIFLSAQKIVVWCFVSKRAGELCSKKFLQYSFYSLTRLTIRSGNINNKRHCKRTHSRRTNPPPPDSTSKWGPISLALALAINTNSDKPNSLSVLFEQSLLGQDITPQSSRTYPVMQHSLRHCCLQFQKQPLLLKARHTNLPWLQWTSFYQRDNMHTSLMSMCDSLFSTPLQCPKTSHFPL